MKLRAMKTLVLAFCVLAIATGGVSCKPDTDGNDGRTNRSRRAKPRGDQRGAAGKTSHNQRNRDQFNKGDQAERKTRREPPTQREQIAAKAQRNKTNDRSSEPSTTIGGMGQPPRRTLNRSAPTPRVHHKWEERRYSADAVAKAQSLAQTGLAEAVAHVGREGSQLVVTYRYAGEDESQVLLVMVNVTAANEGTLQGGVVRMNPAGQDGPMAEGDSVTIDQADVVDWTLIVGFNQYGAFLRQAGLKAKIEAGGDEEGESAATLAELQADLPE